MKNTVKLLSSTLLITVIAAAFASPAMAVDPQGNLSGIWKDNFGNEFMIAQRGNRRISVQYLTDKGNLVWHSATGQARKQGNKWVLTMNLRLKAGGTKPRQGTVVEGQGVIRWKAGNNWTLLATPGMQIAELQQQLAAAQAQNAALTQDLNRLVAKLRAKDDLNRRLRDALARNQRNKEQLQREFNAIVNEYERDRQSIIRRYKQLEAQYAKLLKSSTISGQQKQIIADALGTVQDLAEKAGLEVLGAIGSIFG